MGISDSSFTPILVALVLILIVVIVMAYTLRRLRERKRKLILDLHDSPELVEDRAYNRIRIARSEAEILERSNSSVNRAQELLTRAQEAYDSKNFDSALALADSAHNALVAARRSGAVTPLVKSPSEVHLPSLRDRSATSPGSEGPSRPGVGPVGLGAAIAPSVFSDSDVAAGSSPSVESASGPQSRLPKNRVESHFQLTLLTDEVGDARARKSRDSSAKEAETMRQEAQIAYDRGEFTESLRLALRGRRRLGTLLETLPLRSQVPERKSGAVEEAAKTEDPSKIAAEASEGERCSSCGFPVTANDRYCRGCGAARRGTGQCPKCGAPGKPGDAFCGVCGSPMA